MKLSNQEEYGLRCMLQIAKAGTKSLTINEISAMEGLATTHVAKLLMILRRGGFIESTRGQSGGYLIANPAEEIKVGDLLNCLGGRIYDDEFCTKFSGELDSCLPGHDCSVRSVWQIIQEAIDRALENMTLADLMHQRYAPPEHLQSLPMLLPRREVKV